MRYLAGIVLAVWICICVSGAGAAETSASQAMLESALSMLEKGNPILEHYNMTTGRDVQARFDLGCPYFWGGKSERKLLDVMQCLQPSPGYYVKGRSYLYGFDCSGFIQWLLYTHGYRQLKSISQALAEPESAGMDIEGADSAHGAALTALLQPGDLLAVEHKPGSYHIAMYIGTLRQYGYQEDQVSGALTAWLDAPLIIHCTVSSDYYIRYEAFIEDMYDWYVYPPDGGVIVSVMADRGAAPYTERNPDNDMTTYFLLEDYRLQAYDASADRQVRWMRWPRLRPDA